MSRRGDDFGVELQRRRIAAGLSLADLAARVHYSRGYLSKIENGRQPSADLVRLCDAALEANGELIAVGKDQITRESTGADQKDLVWVMVMDPGNGGWFTPLGRREALLTTGAVTMAGLPLATFARSAGRSAESPLAMFSTWFSQIRALGQGQDPAWMLPLLIGLTHALRGSAASARPTAKPGLLTLAARYAEYTGWMAQESGDDRLALWWTRQAVAMADAGGDPVLGAYALVREALVTLYRDDASQTLDLARRAQADPAASPRVRGLAAIREAQGHALAGHRDESLRALDRARAQLDRSAQDALVLGTSNLSDPVTMVTGWCLHDLGMPSRAAAVLDQELTTIPSGVSRTRVRFAVRRALAYASSGEVDHACALTAELLPALVPLNSATIRIDLRRLARTLARWNTHGPVRHLLPELNTALRVPTA